MSFTQCVKVKKIWSELSFDILTLNAVRPDLTAMLSISVSLIPSDSPKNTA